MVWFLEPESSIFGVVGTPWANLLEDVGSFGLSGSPRLFPKRSGDFHLWGALMMRMSLYVYTYIHTRIHTHIYIYIYVTYLYLHMYA